MYLGEQGVDGGRGGRAGHDQPVVLAVVLGPETEGRGGRQQDKVAAEREKDQPDPQCEQGLGIGEFLNAKLGSISR